MYGSRLGQPRCHLGFTHAIVYGPATTSNIEFILFKHYVGGGGEVAGNGTLRPRSVSAILFDLNVPNFVDVSAKKYRCFGQQIMDVSAKIMISLPRCLCEIDACPPPPRCCHRNKRHATYYVNYCFLSLLCGLINI